jgi:hypothetical protein
MARIWVWDWCVVLWRRGRRQQIENAEEGENAKPLLETREKW